MNRRNLIVLLMLVLAVVVAPTLAAEEAASTNPLTPLGINGGLLLVQLFNFLLVAVILTAVLWTPARNALDARAAKIQKGLEDAAAAAKARQNAEADAEKIMADARAEANKLLADARARGEEVAKSIEAQARTSAQQDADKIRSDAQAAKEAELAGLREQVISISLAVAQAAIGETLDKGKQSKLVSDFFSKVPDAAKGLSGSVEVVSAMPLTADEQKQAQSAIGAQSITFKVDPAILGGLIVRSSEKVIDGSVRSNLSGIASRLS